MHNKYEVKIDKQEYKYTELHAYYVKRNGKIAEKLRFRRTFKEAAILFVITRCLSFDWSFRLPLNGCSRSCESESESKLPNQNCIGVGRFRISCVCVCACGGGGGGGGG